MNLEKLRDTDIDVEVSVPSIRESLTILRLVLSGIVSQLDLNCEQLFDLKLLLEETCNLFMSPSLHQLAPKRLDVKFSLKANTLTVTVSARTLEPELKLSLATIEEIPKPELELEELLAAEGIRLELINRLASSFELSCHDKYLIARFTKKL